MREFELRDTNLQMSPFSLLYNNMLCSIEPKTSRYRLVMYYHHHKPFLSSLLRRKCTKDIVYCNDSICCFFL